MFPSLMRLDQKTLEEGVVYLTGVDPDLAKVIRDFGKPPLWPRQPGFPTLVHIILEQQVSLASANAAFKKLTDSVDQVTPKHFIEFSDENLKGFGFSRQKARYCRLLSEAIISGDFNFEELNQMDDSSARNKLIELKGIGPWTANIYLLMALLRPDIWPPGDLALAKAMQAVKNLPEVPDNETQQKIAAQWKPWRAVGARILWHYYLS
ncbi:MAG: DNA-3-methyladenine glycosylase 2 family protein [Anaerolineae bacterium]|nr:DNA-3-methyladenine glycosylase 2 family protein [Anaerolineae bacterium]